VRDAAPPACHGAVTPFGYTSTRIEIEANRRRSDTFVIHVTVNTAAVRSGKRKSNDRPALKGDSRR
jgi:hypothetical protein